MSNDQQSEIRIGDIVRLNSGSPDLNVKSLNGDDVSVEWEIDGEIFKDTFHLWCIHRVEMD